MFDYNEYLQAQDQYLREHDYLYQFTNPHPDGKLVGDCVKRAITLSGDYDYTRVQLELNRYKKVTKTKKFNERKNWVPYVERVLGWEKLSGYQNMKVGEFAKSHPTGTYLIKVRKHTTTIKDGKILDTWNCAYKAINRVWKIK